MYLTSLFEVLPKQVTMEDIREVETLPRRYKQECEDGEFHMQQVCLSSKPGWIFFSCNFSWSSGLSVLWNMSSILFNTIGKIWKIIASSLWLTSLVLFCFLIHIQNPFCWGRKLHLHYASFFCLFSLFILTSGLKSSTEFIAGVVVVVFGGFLFAWEVHCCVK